MPCIGIRYKGVMYPPDEPPAEVAKLFSDGIKEMLKKRKKENQSFSTCHTGYEEKLDESSRKV